MACNNGSDLVFKEQDVLMTGRCVDRMYEALGKNSQVCCGAPEDSVEDSVTQAIECSLFLVEREWLLEFAEALLSIHASDADVTTESKWQTVRQKFIHKFVYAPFGYGRRRNFDLNQVKGPFYMQKITPDEMKIWRERELI